MVDSLFFDTKSEESDTPMQTEPPEKPNEPLIELCNSDLNLSESKFKPVTTGMNRLARQSGGKILDISDTPIIASHSVPPPQPPFGLFPPHGVLAPPGPFPPGMAPPGPFPPGMASMMHMPTGQLAPPMPPPPGGWKKGGIPPWAKPSESKDNSSSPGKPSLPLFPMPMIPPGPPFPPPGFPMPGNFPFPPPFINPQLFPFPHFGRDMKKIGKRWGRSKRAKGKVDIDKATGRKLITAITCVACFKAKKKCIYADQNAKRCNYCLNRGIDCVKRIDRRCQKVWHESGRRARLYAKAVGGDEDMLEMKDKSEDLGQLKNEDLTNESDKDNEEIGSADKNDLLLSLPSPGRRYFHQRDSKNPLWMLVAENANSSNAQVG